MNVARIVTLNLWGDREPLEARLDACAAGLAALAPDVVLVQEVRHDENLPITADTLARKLGAGWKAGFGCATSAPAGTWGAGSSAGEEGLAVLSKHPTSDLLVTELPEARPLDRRILLSARVEVRGAPLAVHTTHLHYRLGDGVAREKQVVAVDAAARAYAAAGAHAVHVLGGDFNAAPETDEIRFMVGWHTLEGRRATWQDAYARAHPDGAPGWTWASRNPSTDWMPQLWRDRRIDYLFVSPEQKGGPGRVIASRVVLDAPDARGVWPSDHFGVLAEVVVG
jgi:endonuclease/exonuclease/phosphatase family metal-dependent hydrolase